MALPANRRLALLAVIRTVEFAVGFVRVAELLRLVVYITKEWDAARRRKVDLGARAAGLDWRNEDFSQRTSAMADLSI